MIKLPFASSAFFFVFLLLMFQTGTATDDAAHPHCPPSACGGTNISYPFRLETDPISCGDHKYELSCENNLTVLHLYGGKFYVQAINYNNFTVRLVDVNVDKDDCSSVPKFPITKDSLIDGGSYSWDTYEQDNLADSGKSFCIIGTKLTEMIGFIKCPNPVNSSSYLDTSPCINSSLSHSGIYTYAFVGEMKGNDLRDGCSLEMLSLFPRRDSKMRIVLSFIEIHREMAFGFELSWHNINCGNCSSNGCYTDIIELHFQILKLEFKEILGLTLGFLVLVAILSLCMLVIARGFCGCPCVAAFLIYKWRTKHLPGYNTIEEFLQTQNNFMPIRYTYSDIKKMTGGFNKMLGKGGFGSVYIAKLRSGQFAAIKMLEESKANGQDFINEVATIGRIHHANVVRLIGFCSEESKHALVYEFMSNGSLDRHIFASEGSISLSWEKLYEISLGVARGIEYLHRGCEMQILHFDIKPHNILLDKNLVPMISDFGLAKLYPTSGSIASLTAARGTIGYMAPELFYKNIGRVSYKADVYSFGMLLLEMAGKRKNLEGRAEDESTKYLSQIYYPFLVHNKLSDGKLEIEGVTEEENEIVRKMIITGLWCIQMEPSNRPSMNKVVEMLEGNLESLQLPPKPLLCPVQDLPLLTTADFAEWKV